MLNMQFFTRGPGIDADKRIAVSFHHFGRLPGSATPGPMLA
jgi:hypothetical protein